MTPEKIGMIMELLKDATDFSFWEGIHSARDQEGLQEKARMNGDKVCKKIMDILTDGEKTLIANPDSETEITKAIILLSNFCPLVLAIDSETGICILPVVLDKPVNPDEQRFLTPNTHVVEYQVSNGSEETRSTKQKRQS